jgi:hypothetical protein
MIEYGSTDFVARQFGETEAAFDYLVFMENEDYHNWAKSVADKNPLWQEIKKEMRKGMQK